MGGTKVNNLKSDRQNLYRSFIERGVWFSILVNTESRTYTSVFGTL